MNKNTSLLQDMIEIKRQNKIDDIEQIFELSDDCILKKYSKRELVGFYTNIYGEVPTTQKTKQDIVNNIKRYFESLKTTDGILNYFKTE